PQAWTSVRSAAGPQHLLPRVAGPGRTRSCRDRSAPGTAIAVVTRTTRDGAIARALSDPGTTEFVQVQPLWEEGVAAQQLTAPKSKPEGQ
ncbi:MAG: hypothetical protein ACK44Y_04470, partial [Novosphingobium sp.]